MTNSTPTEVRSVTSLLDFLDTVEVNQPAAATFQGVAFSVERTEDGGGQIFIDNSDDVLAYRADLHSRIEVAKDLVFLAHAALETSKNAG